MINKIFKVITCMLRQTTTRGGIYGTRQHEVSNFINAKHYLKVLEHVKDKNLSNFDDFDNMAKIDEKEDEDNTKGKDASR